MKTSCVLPLFCLVAMGLSSKIMTALNIFSQAEKEVSFWQIFRVFILEDEPIDEIGAYL